MKGITQGEKKQGKRFRDNKEGKHQEQEVDGRRTLKSRKRKEEKDEKQEGSRGRAGAQTLSLELAALLT